MAFSTANENAYTTEISDVKLLGDDMIDPLYRAVAEAVEEAILNVLFQAETMTGREFNTFYELPQDQVMSILRKHGKAK